MRKLRVILAIVVFATLLTTTTESAAQSSEMEILNRWVGNWKYHAVLKPSAWSPGSDEQAGTRKVEWILDGQFQQTTGRSGKQETREIQCYDEKSNKYHKWSFDTNDGHSFWIGSWNEESASMTWELVNFGVGITGMIVDRFTSEGKYQTTLVMKDSEGNFLLDIRTEHTRTKKQTK